MRETTGRNAPQVEAAKQFSIDNSVDLRTIELDVASQQSADEAILIGPSAPRASYLAIDRIMGADQWADVGMFMQNIMLLARERGLHTCPQESWASWHRTVSEFLGLPAELMLFCGLAIGYRDESAPINRLRTDRAPVEEFATFHTDGHA